MLTRDLVRFRVYRSRIIPRLVDPGDAELLAVAGELLEVFKAAQGQKRSDLLASTALIIESSPVEAVISRGLEKLLLDRSEFDTAPDETRIEHRAGVFARTSELLSQQRFKTLNAYQQEVAGSFERSPEILAEELYSDLPDFQPLTHFRPLSPERLLHRYNTAQVQGLLLHCSELNLIIHKAEPAALRQLFKYLRFHQLMAEIRKNAEGGYRITVDGPLNLFYKTQKYGINLANFFPAVLHQREWELNAEIQQKNRRKYQLLIDHNCGIQPYFHHFSAYVPEEIKLFQQAFQEKAPGWRIDPAEEFVPLEGEFYCFPDFTLTHLGTGLQVAMELFHPWHATQLTRRLALLENERGEPLIIGVSKVLLKDPLVKEAVDGSHYFGRCGFIFREMPTLQKVLPVLEKLLG